MKKLLLAFAAGLAGFGMSCGYAQAQTPIDQAKALAGNVTPGDAPGFPVTLSQPGSYKLTSNLTVPANTKGIVIAANNVTLDLNGFTVSGAMSCTRDASTKMVSCAAPPGASEVFGISAAATFGTVVRNGTVKGFARGIAAGGSGRYDELRLTENGIGIDDNFSSGTYGNTLSHCVVDLNWGDGVRLMRGLVSDCHLDNNDSHGISGAVQLVVSGSHASGNRFYGLFNVAARDTATVGNGLANRSNVISLGGNMDGQAPF